MSPVTELDPWELPDDLFLKSNGTFRDDFSKMHSGLQKALGWHKMIAGTSLGIGKLSKKDLDRARPFLMYHQPNIMSHQTVS